jgi:hypothetical protein
MEKFQTALRCQRSGVERFGNFRLVLEVGVVLSAAVCLPLTCRFCVARNAENTIFGTNHCTRLHPSHYFAAHPVAQRGIVNIQRTRLKKGLPSPAPLPLRIYRFGAGAGSGGDTKDLNTTEQIPVCFRPWRY